MMSIGADTFIVVIGGTEECPELGNGAGLAHYSRQGMFLGMGRLTP